jgi:outer membrane protein assembly factor BamA
LEKNLISPVNKLLISFFKCTVIIIILTVIIVSCSPVKFVPADQYLLNKAEIEVDNSGINRDEAKRHIRQKENYKILGFLKFHLWLYNLSNKEKSDDWLKRIGEPPEIYDPALADASGDRLKQYLESKGYFRSTVDPDLKFNDRKRKVNVKYKISTGDQYKIHSVNYHFGDSVLQPLFFKDTAKTFLQPGSAFDFDLLEKHRSSVVDLYKNNGFFYISRDDVSYLADSSRFDTDIVLDMFIGNINEPDSLKKFSKYHLDQFYISVLSGSTSFDSPQDPPDAFSDTVSWDNYTLYRSNEMKYRPGLFEDLMQMESGSLYRLNDAKNTFNAFNRLRQFRFIDIQFRESVAYRDSQLLDCYVRLAPVNKQAVSFDVEGTNTSGNLGIAGNVNYRHRNLLNGAELLHLNFKGAMERQQRVIDNVPEYFNTREFGVETNLTIPKLLGPGKIIDVFRDFLPQTVFTLGYNFQRRPEYTRTISNFKFGYDWMTSEKWKHTFNLIDFNMVNLYQFDPDFIDFIKDLYIKSSFTDHLIFATNYSVIYNKPYSGVKQNYTYMRINVESAGNLLRLASGMINRPKVTVTDSQGLGSSEYYQVLNTRFAQYVKSDIEFRYGYRFNKYNSVVGRAFLGAGLPYGNFDVLPFEKKYFTGGANGIRAWQVRSLGPGTYRAPPNNYPNQSSDIKLEGNIEYRFNLIGFLEGAFFLDAGNIWAINKKDNRPGALFRAGEFYKQLAFGTGTGFRFDFKYFIFRLDLGMKLRDPSQAEGNGWIIGTRPVNSDDFNISFAIGYPF